MSIGGVETLRRASSGVWAARRDELLSLRSTRGTSPFPGEASLPAGILFGVFASRAEQPFVNGVIKLRMLQWRVGPDNTESDRRSGWCVRLPL